MKVNRMEVVFPVPVDIDENCRTILFRLADIICKINNEAMWASSYGDIPIPPTEGEIKRGRAGGSAFHIGCSIKFATSTTSSSSTTLDLVKNQIRILCNNCGCYYYWDIEFERKDYGKAVNQTPREANIYCPECHSQEIARHAPHSAGYFNCEGRYFDKLPRYAYRKGSVLEPLGGHI